MPPRLQSTYQLHHNNAVVTATPNPAQINNVYSFCQHYQEYLSHFISKSQEVAHHTSLSALILINQNQQFAQLLEQVEREGYVFLDCVSDHAHSYKGWVSWVTVGFKNKGYVIDALVLNKSMSKLSDIMQNPQVIKYCYRLGILLDDFKRDWSIFGVNCFDFELFEKNIGVKRGVSINCFSISEHPLSTDLYEQLQQRYDLMIKYIFQMRYFMEKSPEDYPLYAYSNHYELMLKEYHHPVFSLQEEEKKYEGELSEKRNRSYEEKENTVDNGWGQDDELVIRLKGERDRRICQLILQWRQHMAKILDCPVTEILTFSQIVKLAVERPTSVLQIERVVADNMTFSLDIYSKILQVLAYESEMHENINNELYVRGNRRAKQEKNIKALLTDLKWQGREEWLNRRNDESIKLYKEIVSIMELDGSVVDQFIEGMGRGVVGKNQINRFIKYAQYMRNGNHRKLKEYFDNNIPLESGWEQEDGWESEEETVFITGHRHSTSQTSISEMTQKNVQKQEENTRATLPGCSHSSLPQSSDLGPFKKTDSLPENIEEIYLKAVNVKKGYTKIQKKKGKKDIREEEDFVPTWQDIKLLLQI